MIQNEFDYQKAFCRNIGWLTLSEQEYLRSKTVAIAGMGGVGGVHLLTLVRLGIEKFHIADMDVFEIQNFNRQAGANLTSLHQPKVDVLEKMAKEINPNITFTVFPNGINKENISEFLAGVDLYIDGLDFFVLDIRSEVFKRAYDLHIPAITAGPLGMGTAYLIFMPGQMTFAQYFCFKQSEPDDLAIRFLIGLNPTFSNRRYLVEPGMVNLQLKKGPSTIVGCQLSAGVMGAETVKILLNRGPIFAAPYYHLFDPYLYKHKIGWLPWGNRNPLQLLKYYLVKRKLKAYTQTKAHYLNPEKYTDIEKILDLARWAPSGDNSQPWRFKIVDDHHVIVNVTNEANTNRYDYAGIPTHISSGCLLETIRLAATLFNLKLSYQYLQITNGEYHIDIRFTPLTKQNTDPLAYCIMERSVDRRRYELAQLTAQAKAELAAAVGDEFTLLWFERFRDRLALSKITMLATKIRMIMPELYPIHKQAFTFTGDCTEEGIPIKATGMNRISSYFMKWALTSQLRINMMNHIGAIPSTQLELDFLPGIFCGAHFMLIEKNKSLVSKDKEYYLRVGVALQRFWLTATKLGLVVQPNLAPIMLTYYSDNNIPFTENTKLLATAQQLAVKLHKFDQGNTILLLGRIGYPKRPKQKVRSTRKSLSSLLQREDNNEAI